MILRTGRIVRTDRAIYSCKYLVQVKVKEEDKVTKPASQSRQNQLRKKDHRLVKDQLSQNDHLVYREAAETRKKKIRTNERVWRRRSAKVWRRKRFLNINQKSKMTSDNLFG